MMYTVTTSGTTVAARNTRISLLRIRFTLIDASRPCGMDHLEARPQVEASCSAVQRYLQAYPVRNESRFARYWIDDPPTGIPSKSRMENWWRCWPRESSASPGRDRVLRFQRDGMRFGNRAPAGTLCTSPPECRS